MARVLVVNDNESISSMLEAVVSMAGHDVSMAHSSGDALRKLRSQIFDVMLLDVGMPELCGYELLEVVRDLPDRGRMPVIMVAAGDGDETYRGSQPVDAGALLGAIEQAVGRARGAQIGTNPAIPTANHPA